MVGLIGTKVGMTQVFSERGELIPVTVIQVKPNTVVALKKEKEHGYDSVLLGYGDVKEQRLNKAYCGQFTNGMAPLALLKEFRDFDKEVAVGDKIGVEILESVRYLDVTATSKGKGFQGVMKRWNFGGGRKTHGSKFHREAGSTGQCTSPGRTFKNAKMPGRMGAEKVTVQNLRIVKTDADLGVVLVRGAVPGRKNASVFIRSSVKKG